MRLVGTPSELPTTVPASAGEVRGAHGRFEVLAMDGDDTDSVVSAVSFEEGFERDLGEIDNDQSGNVSDEEPDGISVVSGVEDPRPCRGSCFGFARDNSQHIRDAFRRLHGVDVETFSGGVQWL